MTGFRERQRIVKDYIINETQPYLDTAFLFAEKGLPYKFDSTIRRYLDCQLQERTNPDFYIISLIRILQYDETYAEEIKEALSKVDYWLTKGNTVVSFCLSVFLPIKESYLDF